MAEGKRKRNPFEGLSFRQQLEEKSRKRRPVFKELKRRIEKIKRRKRKQEVDI